MDNYQERMMAYQLSTSVARKMLSMGIITEDDYRKIDTIIAKKYGICLDSLYRQISKE